MSERTPDNDAPAVLRNAGPWQHLDGTPCPYYVASRPRPDADNHWWCTEHQQHVRVIPPVVGEGQ